MWTFIGFIGDDDVSYEEVVFALSVSPLYVSVTKTIYLSLSLGAQSLSFGS